MNEHTYIMDGERIPESGMQKWHNDRGLPWGREYQGPDPITVRRMVPAGTSRLSLSVHVANEHGIDLDKARLGWSEVEHMYAHMTGRFRKGQEHYHGEVQPPPKVKVCIGCEAEQGRPHQPWCPVVTGTLSTLPGGDRDHG